MPLLVTRTATPFSRKNSDRVLGLFRLNVCGRDFRIGFHNVHLYSVLAIKVGKAPDVWIVVDGSRWVCFNLLMEGFAESGGVQVGNVLILDELLGP